MKYVCITCILLPMIMHRYGNLIKCNPAIKAPENKAALWEALLDDRLDIIATDHAPHTWEEKQQPYQQAPQVCHWCSIRYC